MGGRESSVWDDTGRMNALDVLIVLLVVAAAVGGIRRGALLQVALYGGMLLGLLVGLLATPGLARLVESPMSQAVIALAAPLALAGLGQGVGWLVGIRLRRLTRPKGLVRLDALLGGVVGGVISSLLIWFLALNLANGPLPEVSRAIRSSAILQTLDRRLPHPPSVIGQARRFLDRFGFPEVFLELPPPPAGPVEGPGTGEIAITARQAERSTVQVVGAACGRIQAGSGFIVAPHYVVTNAHVVAGVARPRVQAQNVRALRAATVLFDPRLDLAVLRLEDFLGPALSLEEQELGRGATGAVLGYPQGNDLTIRGAGVRRRLRALGRDIYGQTAVSRDVYELQAVVRPGDSGGPFVSEGGNVAGMVFAASAGDTNIAYALTSRTLLTALAPVLGRTQAVSTNGCPR